MSLFSRLVKRLRLHNAPTVDMHSIKGIQARPLLYQRYPPWWAQWAYALIAVDVIQTTSILDLTWNKWTMLDPTQDAKTTPKEEQRFVPQPAWKRGLVCAAHSAIGVGIAAVLVVIRARYVRTFTVVPGANGRRNVFAQSAAHMGSKGILFPISKCRLQTGRVDNELILRVEGERGHWFVNLFGTVLRGQDLERQKTFMDKKARQEWKEECAYTARLAILKEWGDAKKIGDFQEPELRRILGMKQRLRAMEEKTTAKR